MKKLFTCCAALFVSANCLYAQGEYIRIGIGYTLPEGSQTLGTNGNPLSGTLNSTGTTTLYDVNKVSFSTGFHAVVGSGYMLTKNIGVEIAADFLPGSKTYTAKETNVLNPAGSYLSDAVFTARAKLPIYIMPALVLQSGGTKLNVYARGALAIPLNCTITSEEKYTYQSALSSVEDLQSTIKMKTSLGFAGAMGASYNVSDNMAIWGELNILLSTIYAKEQDITAHTISGQSAAYLPSGTTIKYGANGNYNSTQQPTYSLPFSNAGLQLGISFKFTNKDDKNKK